MNESAAKILDTAKKLITSDRSRQYGPYEEETKKEAIIIKELTGLDIKPDHIPIIMIVVKLVRERHVHKSDNFIDICGYASLADQIKSGDNDGGQES